MEIQQTLLFQLGLGMNQENNQKTRILFMRKPLVEATNKKNLGMRKEAEKDIGDKDRVTAYLREVTDTTKDHSLKYDIQKCLEIIEGKENQEVAELKEEFVRVYEEREILFSEKCDLVVENEYLKSLLKDCEECHSD